MGTNADYQRDYRKRMKAKLAEVERLQAQAAETERLAGKVGKVKQMEGALLEMLEMLRARNGPLAVELRRIAQRGLE